MYSPFTAQWLAAMEKSRDVPAGVYQMQYSTALNDSMQDSLLEDPLAAAVVTVADNNSDGGWSGTPTELLSAKERCIPETGHRLQAPYPSASSRCRRHYRC